jgi:hypothetical protein
MLFSVTLPLQQCDHFGSEDSTGERAEPLIHQVAGYGFLLEEEG